MERCEPAPHVLHRDGEPVAKSVGALPKARLEQALGLEAELEQAA